MLNNNLNKLNKSLINSSIFILSRAVLDQGRVVRPSKLWIGRWIVGRRRYYECIYET